MIYNTERDTDFIPTGAEANLRAAGSAMDDDRSFGFCSY